ncbi:optineurin isoform 2-T2 [Rhinophrynus dorsalis]
MANQLLNQVPVNDMENGHPDFADTALHVKNDAEMLEQIKQLLLENNKLKETMKQMNQEMKERLEELMKRQNNRLLDLSNENELLRNELHSLKEKMAEPTQEITASSTSEETNENSKQLKSQLLRLQAEKADLLGIISELQLKLGSCSSEDSFIEIRIAEKGSGVEMMEDKADSGQANHEIIAYRANPNNEKGNGLESEELTVSRLLHSLREETQKVETLEKELMAVNERVAKLEKKANDLCDIETQTEREMEQEEGESHSEEIISSEVDALKLEITSLKKELQDTNDKLHEAEQLKNSLQNNCASMYTALHENQFDLEEKQKLSYAVQKLELQLESMRSELKLEQTKTQSEIIRLASLQGSYDKLKWEYEEIKQAESESVPKEQFQELLQKLNACEKALAKKQFEIDEMRGTMEKHQEEMETIGLLRAQIDVYCSDFHAEREARENIHQEKEALAARLAYVLKENEKLKDDILGRESIEQLQRRHGSTRSADGSDEPYLVQRGAESLEPRSIHTCPKCNLTVPDMDTLQIHVMDCIT